MRVPGLLLLAAAVAVGGACSGQDDHRRVAATNALAAEVDRVATMLADDRPCQALVATRTVELLADADHVEADVRDAVLAHIEQARQVVDCQPGEEATSEPPATPSEDDRAKDDKEDDGDDDDHEEDDDDEKRGRGKGNGRGRPGDR